MLKDFERSHSKPKKKTLPLQLFLITAVTLIILVFIAISELKTDEQINALSGDHAELVRSYDERSKGLSLFAILVISFSASAILLAYWRYERRLEFKVEEQTRELKDVMRFNQDMLDNSPIGILTIDFRGEIVYASPAMRNIAGVKSEKNLVGLNILDMKASEEAGLIEYFTQGLEGKSFDIEDVSYTSQTTGKKSIRHYRGVPLLDEWGNVKYLQLLIEDVSEKRRVEAEMMWTIDGTSTPIFLIDLNHKVRFWNKAMEELTGFKKEDILGTNDHWKAFYDEYHPTLADILVDGEIDSLPQLYEKYSPSTLIPNAYQAEGWRIKGTKYISFTASPICDPHGQLIAVVETVNDLTDSIISDEHYKNIVDNVNDLIMLLNTKGEVVFANEKLEEMFGYSQEDLLMTSFTRLIHESDKDRVILSILHASESSASLKNIEMKAKRKDSSEFYVEISSGFMKHDGQVTGIHLILRDITERKKAEKLIKRELEELKKLDELKDDFVAITAHEMKTPLISILTLPDMMLDDETLTDEQIQNLKILLSDGRKLKTIISRILTESRLKSGKINYDFTDCSFLDLVEEQLCTFDMRFKEKNVIFQLNVPKNLPQVKADVNLIGEVVTNLLDNALKFTKEGGSITLEAKLEGDMVVVGVADSGIGIKAEHLTNVFDKFYQIEHRDDRNYGGTGLGLHICEEIMEKHGGKIWVESEYEVGTTFYFSLPICGNKG